MKSKRKGFHNPWGELVRIWCGPKSLLYKSPAWVGEELSKPREPLPVSR